MTRQDEILKLIVEEFISTAEPVGSMTLLDKYHLQYSSATVRHEMAELEDKGFLEKTHTSSGRVPSSKGYRYYVSNLKEDMKPSVDEEFKKEFQLIMKQKSQSVEDIMEKSCQIMSEMTNLAVVVLGPNAENEHLVSINVVPISSKALTSIFVTDKGYVENKTFMIHSEQEGHDITKCVDFLNKRLAGTSVGEISDKVEALKPILSKVLGRSSDLIMQAFVEAFVKFAKDRMYSQGSSNLLGLPEYSGDREKLQNILDLLDSPEKLKEAIGKSSVDENSMSYMQDNQDDVAIISKDFDITGMPEAKLAIVGPQRMDYKKIMSTLNYIAEEVTKYFGGEAKLAENKSNEKKHNEKNTANIDGNNNPGGDKNGREGKQEKSGS